MAAVFASEAQVLDLVAPGAVSIAAVNAPDNVVISGEGAAVRDAVARIEAQGIRTEPLAVSHAFHSHLMDPMLDDFEKVAAGVTSAPARLGFVSNVTGRLMRGDFASPAYWRTHVRSTVKFAESIGALHQLGATVFLEIGPRPTLSGLGRRCVVDDAAVWLPSLSRGRDESRQMLESLGRLYVAGGDIDWRGFDGDYRRCPQAMPTYPFERRRFWIDTAPASPRHSVERRAGRPIHPLLGHRLDSASRDLQFEAEIATTTTPYLADHVKKGTAIMPATALLEMALATAPIADVGPVAVHDLVIVEPLPLHDASPQIVQSIVTPEGPDLQFSLYSRTDDEANGSNWRRACDRHAQASGRRTLRRFDGGPSQRVRPNRQCD